MPILMSIRRRPRAFTLVELLVVIGLLAVLISLLLPMLGAARVRAERVSCASRLRSLAQAVHLYAIQNKGRLPAGTRDGENLLTNASEAGEHCIWISSPTYDAFAHALAGGSDKSTKAFLAGGSSRDLVERQLACPSLERDLPFYAGVDRVGWVIGYNYLGNHALISNVHKWPVPSPVRLDSKGNPPLLADLNDWSPQDRWTCVPHQRDTGAGFYYGDYGGRPPDDPYFDAAGGNVALLDGSVEWRHLSDMMKYPTYSESGTAYMGMW